jgi:plasmid stabilization system protein ParE
MSFEVVFTETALQAYVAIPDWRIQRVDSTIDALGLAPWVGRVYDPVYEAARPPFEVRVVYADIYGIYYTVDEDASTVVIRFIEDQRMDPATRFVGRLGG